MKQSITTAVLVLALASCSNEPIDEGRGVVSLEADAALAETGGTQREQPRAPAATGSERGALLKSLEDYSVVVETWQRRARPGSLMRTYDVTAAAGFDPGEPKFTPEPGKTYFYVNVARAALWTPTGENSHAA